MELSEYVVLHVSKAVAVAVVPLTVMGPHSMLSSLISVTPLSSRSCVADFCCAAKSGVELALRPDRSLLATALTCASSMPWMACWMAA